MRILVISDIHAHSGDPADGPSWFSTSPTWEDPANNPLNGICALMNKEGLGVDLIVCPGDMGDRADPVAQKMAWSKLCEIKAKLNAKHLMGSAGNHDLDSRRADSDLDPRGTLLSLEPPFPVSGPASDALRPADSYWARNFVISRLEEWSATILNVNSSAFHGYASEAGKVPDEHRHGRISRLTRESVANSLGDLPTRINVLLTHHHLKQHPYVEDQNSVMIGGDLLLETLKETGKQWLVIHGHQHVPMISYADADYLAPIVLSSASVSAKTYQVRGKHARNQIHHIEIDLTGEPRLFGLVRTYSWFFGVGWARSSPEETVPHLMGFGYKPDLVKAADDLIEAVRAAGSGPVRWEKAIEGYPNLRFMMIQDHRAMMRLAKQKGLAWDDGASGLPSMVEFP